MRANDLSHFGSPHMTVYYAGVRLGMGGEILGLKM